MTYLRSLDIPSFTDFQESCRDAIKHNKAMVLSVDRIIGIPDYDLIFSDFNSASVSGTSSTNIYIKYNHIM